MELKWKRAAKSLQVTLVSVFVAITICLVAISINLFPIWTLQNHVYCELLTPGMTREEVEEALLRVGPYKRWDFPPSVVVVDAVQYLTAFEFRDVSTQDMLSLTVGFDVNDRLVWKGMLVGIDVYRSIECPFPVWVSILSWLTMSLDKTGA
jgi:hypothetical protein